MAVSTSSFSHNYVDSVGREQQKAQTAFILLVLTLLQVCQ